MAMDSSFFPESQINGNVPFSIEAEQSVLGAILLESSCLDTVMEILPRADYFYGTNNRHIYSAMLEMFNFGMPIDFITLLEKLKENSEFDQDDGKVYLLNLAQIVPSISNVTVYAGIVRDNYDVRVLMQTARGIYDDAAAGEQSSSLLLDSAEQRIFDIRQGKNMKGLQHIKEILPETFDRLDMLSSEESDQFKPLPTGIKRLDQVITGLNKSDLVILAARPGIGKTSFALNISNHISLTTKKKVAFFSLEMGKEQLVSRILSMVALVDAGHIKTGNLSDNEWRKLIEAGDLLRGTEYYLDDTPGITVPEMKAKVRRLKNVDLVVIDYLQLMNSARRIDNRVQEVAEITRSLKIMAKELDVPVLALSQLSRSGADGKPKLTDLRDSGSIEQDADIVMFLYREGAQGNQSEDSVPDEDTDVNACECIVAKNRHGSTDEIPMHWQGEVMRFTAREVIRHE